MHETLLDSTGPPTWWRFARRDLVIIALTLTCWLLTHTATDSALPGRLAGGLAILSAFLLHEWGHWLGARWSRSRISLPATLASPFLYNFDAQQNNRRQFLITSVAGFAATGVFLVAYFLLLPDSHPGTALACNGALVLATLTLVFEVPIAIAVAAGWPIPELKLFGRAAPDSQPRSTDRIT
ncbi:MAG: hypothetical protein AAGI15_12015 [Pseudomonadota bacterium]